MKGMLEFYKTPSFILFIVFVCLFLFVCLFVCVCVFVACFVLHLSEVIKDKCDRSVTRCGLEVTKYPVIELLDLIKVRVVTAKRKFR